MALIRSLKISLGVDSRGFTGPIAASVSSLTALDKGLKQAQASASKLDLSRIKPPPAVKSHAGAGAGGSGGLPEMEGASDAMNVMSLVGAKSAISLMEIVAGFEMLGYAITGNLVTMRLYITAMADMMAVMNPAAAFTVDYATTVDDATLTLKEMAAEMKSLSTASSSTVAPVKGVTGAVRGVTGAVKSLWSALGPLVAVFSVFKAVTAFTDFVSDGVKSAIDLAETMDKTRDVFLDSSNIIIDQSEKMSQRFGFVKGELLEAASNIGLLGTSAGLTEAKAADLSSRMLKLAADAVSFNNVPLDTALEKIRSGLSGEAEPLRAFGVLLSEDALKAEAARMKMGAVSGKLTEQTKILVRAELITRGLTKAKDNLVKTEHSVSNEFRKSEGTIANFGTAVGAVLMPVVKEANLAFQSLLLTIIQTFESTKPVFEGWVSTIASGLDFVGSVIRNFSDYWTILKLSATETVANVILQVEYLGKNLALIGNWFADNWANLLIDGMMVVLKGFMNLAINIRDLWISVMDGLSGKGWKFEPTDLLEGFQAMTGELPEMLKAPVVSMQDEMLGIFDKIEKKDIAFKGAGVKPVAPAKAVVPAAKAETPEYKGTAAVEMGSKEAASAIAKHYQRPMEDRAAAATVKELPVQTKALMSMQQALKEIALRGGSDKLSSYTF